MLKPPNDLSALISILSNYLTCEDFVHKCVLHFHGVGEARFGEYRKRGLEKAESSVINILFC